MRRGSIRLPAEIDRDAKREQGKSGDDHSTMRRMEDHKNRFNESTSRLSMILQRTSIVDEDIDKNSEASGTVVRRAGKSLRKHTSVPDFLLTQQGRGTMAGGDGRGGSKETVKSTTSRRSSFRPEDQAQAAHFAKISKSTDGAGELSKWINAEMITRRQDETQNETLTLRQLMKVDDRINVNEFAGRKYDGAKKADDSDDEDAGPSIKPNSRTRLRHSISYRMASK